MLWLDHRATPEAEAITAAGHPVLDHAGGALSPEMQLPKLLWLKRHLPATWSRAALAFDLADFLAWAATGNPARSQCTLACKWGYLAHEPAGWPHGLPRPHRPRRPPRPHRPARDRHPRRHRPRPAHARKPPRDLGLTPATRVATGLIDAHAGALGVLGHLAGAADLERHLALIGGTSSCLMALAAAPRPIPGIWGPLPRRRPPRPLAQRGRPVRLRRAPRPPPPPARPRAHPREPRPRHCPRRRAPRARPRTSPPASTSCPTSTAAARPTPDPHALGVVSGLPLDASFDALCRLYWRTCVGLALGLRAILDHLAAHGVPVDTLHVAGGHTRHPLLIELYPDATGCPIVEPAAPDAVLLGTAMAAAAAAGLHPSLAAAARAMGQGGTLRTPDPASAARVERDWRAFRAMQRHRAEIDALTRG